MFAGVGVGAWDGAWDGAVLQKRRSGRFAHLAHAKLLLRRDLPIMLPLPPPILLALLGVALLGVIGLVDLLIIMLLAVEGACEASNSTHEAAAVGVAVFPLLPIFVQHETCQGWP